MIIPVHKSMPMPVTRRSWIYTAISRARSRCVLVGQPDEVERMIARKEDEQRYTRLTGLLKETVSRAPENEEGDEEEI